MAEWLRDRFKILDLRNAADGRRGRATRIEQRGSSNEGRLKKIQKSEIKNQTYGVFRREDESLERIANPFRQSRRSSRVQNDIP